MGLCASKAPLRGGQQRQAGAATDGAPVKQQQPAAADTPTSPEPQRCCSTGSGAPAAAAGAGSTRHSPQPASPEQPNGLQPRPAGTLASPTAATDHSRELCSSSNHSNGSSMLTLGGSAGLLPAAVALPDAACAVGAADHAAWHWQQQQPQALQQQPHQQPPPMQPRAVLPAQVADVQQQQQQQHVAHQWDRAASLQAPSALAGVAGSSKPATGPGSRSVKFAEPPPDSDDSSQPLQGASAAASRSGARHAPAAASAVAAGARASGSARRAAPRRSMSSSGVRSGGSNEVSAAVLAHQVEILRSNKAGKLRLRRAGLDTHFTALQDSLTQDQPPVDVVATRAAGLKHIGFGPFKRENQDEFFIQVGDFGGVPGGNLFCVFDGHGSHGKDAALASRQLLPCLLDAELRQYFTRVTHDTEHGLRGAVDVLITEVFGETERSLAQSGVNLASSGTTATVAFQRGNRLWVAAAGDSRAILCTRNARDQWRALPLTIDHRPRRPSERERIEAAGARVAPKRLPSGRSVGEPRLWLQDAGGPGLLLSRSLGDLTAATVGCTSDPEVTFSTLRAHVDHVLVLASDGVWDVLTNEQVCDIVVESPDPHIACRRVLDAALYEWEERMSADNITVLVVEFEWAGAPCDEAAQHQHGGGSAPAQPPADMVQTGVAVAPGSNGAGTP